LRVIGVLETLSGERANLSLARNASLITLGANLFEKIGPFFLLPHNIDSATDDLLQGLVVYHAGAVVARFRWLTSQASGHFHL
jgi:hypothetical protein